MAKTGAFFANLRPRMARGAGRCYDTPMVEAKKQRMTVDQFLPWAEAQAERYELFDGAPIAMAPERAAHWKMKLAVHVALLAAIGKARLPCHVVPDGATVRIDAFTAYEPDGLVYCGPEVAPGAMIVENPLIIVEVLSPSTGRADRGRKLSDYFRIPSLSHYLIVDCDAPLIVHHQRRDGGDILTRIFRDGALTLDPPGIELRLEEIYKTPS